MDRLSIITLAAAKAFTKSTVAALEQVVRYIGVTTTAISDGSTTNPVTINGQSVTAVAGDTVFYNGTSYAWDGSAWQEVMNIAEIISAVEVLGTKVHDILGDIAPEFNSASTYAVDDVVLYEDDLYVFTSAHTGAWDSGDVFVTNIAQLIEDMRTEFATALSAKQDTLPLSFSGNDITTNGNLTAAGHVKDGFGNDMEALSALEATASGNPIVVNAQDVAAKGLKVTFEPIQSGTGDPSPTNIRPISGRTETGINNHGKNYCNLANVTNNKYLSSTGSETDANGYAITDYLPIAPSRQYCVSGTSNVNNTYTGFYDANKTLISTTAESGESFTFTTPANARYVRVSLRNIATNNPQIEEGTTPTTYEPYTGVTITKALGQTVYGGNLDVKTGVLTIDSAYLTENDFIGMADNVSAGGLHYVVTEQLDNFDTSKNVIVSMLPYVRSGAWASTTPISSYGTKEIRVYCTETSLEVFKTAYADLQLVYPLATPTTVQLTPAQLELLKGYNYITGDGIIDLVYVPESITGQAEGMFVPISMLGTNESGNTKASRAYTSGEYFYQNGKMYKATTSIASGATFTVGTNCTQTTLFAELKAAQN